MDDNLGRLCEYLDQTGLAENTIVVVCSDHGEMHGSHGRLDKMVPYTEAVAIPLILRWSGRVSPLKTDALVTPMDLLPTLAALAEITVPREVDGIDLSDVVRGRGRSSREEVLMSNYSSHWDYFQTGTSWPEWRGIRTKRHTYCKWLSGEEELYDDLEGLLSNEEPRRGTQGTARSQTSAQDTEGSARCGTRRLPAGNGLCGLV